MDNTRVWARLDPEIHEYLFRHVLAGNHGARQELTTQFFAALYAECQRRKIPPAWSAESAEAIQSIMSHLNFNETDRSRCPLDSTTKHQGEPFGDGDDPRAAHRLSSEAPSPAFLDQNP